MHFSLRCAKAFAMVLAIGTASILPLKDARARAVSAPPTYQGAVFYHDPNGNLKVMYTSIYTTVTLCQSVGMPLVVAAIAPSPPFPSSGNTILGQWNCQQTPLPPIDFF